MIARYLLAILIILCPPVFAADPISVIPQPDGTTVIILSPEATKMCEEQGGCKIISRDVFMEYIKQIKPNLCAEKEI